MSRSLKIATLTALSFALAACGVAPHTHHGDTANVYSHNHAPDGDSHYGDESRSRSYVSGVNPDSQEPLRPRGSAFDRFLHDGYMWQAKREDFEHDFEDLAKFKERGERAGRGMFVAPEELSARDLPPHTVAELGEARRRLENAFYAGASVKMPQESAEAQVKFDCWMEQQEEDIQPHDIRECKLAFFDALAKIENGMLPPQDHRHPQPEQVYTHSHQYEHQHGPNSCVNHTHEPVEHTADVIVYRGPYIVFFDLDKSLITPEAQAVLDRVVTDVKQMKPNKIVVTGHTDTSGTGNYNDGLSQRRVDAVVTRLQDEGLGISIIRAFHYGERKQRVLTADGVRHPENRRVEISFEW